MIATQQNHSTATAAQPRQFHPAETMTHKQPNWLDGESVPKKKKTDAVEIWRPNLVKFPSPLSSPPSCGEHGRHKYSP